MRVIYFFEEFIRFDKARFIQFINTWKHVSNFVKLILVHEGCDNTVVWAKNVRVNRFKIKFCGVKISSKFPMFYAFVKIVKKINPNLIYTRYRDTVIVVKSIYPNIPCIFLWEEPVFMREKWIKKFLIFIKEKLAITLSDLVVVVSPIQNSVLFHLYGIAKKTVLAHNGGFVIDNLVVNKEKKVFYVGYIGSCVKSKGIDLIFETANMLNMKFKSNKVFLKIIGKCEYDKVESMICTGWLPQREALLELGKCDLAILPLEEQLMFTSPMKLYDYLSLDIPFVYIPTSFSKLHLSSKIAVDKSKSEFCTAVCNLVMNPLVRKKRSRNIKRKKTKLTWNNRATKIYLSIKNLVGSVGCD